MAGAVSALFLLDIKGRVLIWRDHRGDVSTVQAERFFTKLIEKELEYNIVRKETEHTHSTKLEGFLKEPITYKIVIGLHTERVYDATNTNVRTSMGSAKYAPENDALVWKIKSFPGGKEYMCRAEFSLPSITAEEATPEKKAPIRVKFEIPYFTVSGIQVCRFFVSWTIIMNQ
ncbi:hypothetical protein B296_00025103 [Ensete ventricosum]|uniref:MHD domain-containing protein n=1 Tax=Ensete ventricosum TaxID=4639 RepID=A0A427ANN4_ENSVE|nr:hypothetical protein B296_00025103 [Ensete ventricosum]